MMSLTSLLCLFLFFWYDIQRGGAVNIGTDDASGIFTGVIFKENTAPVSELCFLSLSLSIYNIIFSKQSSIQILFLILF